MNQATIQMACAHALVAAARAIRADPASLPTSANPNTRLVGLWDASAWLMEVEAPRVGGYTYLDPGTPTWDLTGVRG